MSDVPQPRIDVPEAQALVLGAVRPGPKVRLPLREALFRTLAEPVCCDIDYPPFDRSLMDGYAVRAADVSSPPVRLRVIGQVAAGAVPDRWVKTGEAVQINTGAPIPPGADAVVRVEDAELDSSKREVAILKAAAIGQFITLRGAFVTGGQRVLSPGQRLTPLELAAAAAAGAATVTVYRKPAVSILSTGDELVDLDRVPRGAEIRDSNQYLLEALTRSAFAEPVLLGVAGDDPELIRRKVFEGLLADVLCITGGVSMGEFDFVPPVLAECGTAFHVHKMAIKPGRPTIFGTTPEGKLIFALPGNPVSAFIGFELLVRPALAALEGRPGSVSRASLATLHGKLNATAERRSYWPARVTLTEDGQWNAETLSWQGSGDPFGMAGANALIMRPPHSNAVNAGDCVSILLLDRIG